MSSNKTLYFNLFLSSSLLVYIYSLPLIFHKGKKMNLSRVILLEQSHGMLYPRRRLKELCQLVNIVRHSGKGGVCIVTGRRPGAVKLHSTEWYGKCCWEVDGPGLVHVQLERFRTMKPDHTVHFLCPVKALNKRKCHLSQCFL